MAFYRRYETERLDRPLKCIFAEKLLNRCACKKMSELTVKA